MICRARSWIDETNRQRRIRSAFTLIEMVVVLMLIGTIAGAAMYSLQKPLRTARIKRALASIEDADRRAREEARRTVGNVVLTINGDKGIATQAVSSQSRTLDDTRALPFSGGLHIDKVIGAEGFASNGQFDIRFTPDGQSSTYAVRLSTNRSERESRRTWVVVVGATGQYIRSNEDAVVESIISMQP